MQKVKLNSEFILGCASIIMGIISLFIFFCINSSIGATVSNLVYYTNLIACCSIGTCMSIVSHLGFIKTLFKISDSAQDDSISKDLDDQHKIMKVTFYAQIFCTLCLVAITFSAVQCNAPIW